MRIALGFYTLISNASESSALNRALNYVYQPVLSYLYNSQGNRIFLYQSSYMMKHIREHRAEFKTLISFLAKRGDIEFLTGSYNQSILSLMLPKDRPKEIERLTSQIRKDYLSLSDSAFFYGEVFSTSFFSALKNCKVESIVISPYNTALKSQVSDESFMMNELGKRLKVYITSDAASRMVQSYSLGDMGLEGLFRGLRELLSQAKTRDIILFLNIDQILMGAIREGKLEELPQFFLSLMKSLSGKLVPLSEIKVTKNGYLNSGWYSRDVYSGDLLSFNEVFVRNENFRYLYNRYIGFYDLNLKEDKGKKAAISSTELELGPLFAYDSQFSPLSKKSRDSFWSYILERDEEFSDQISSAFSRGVSLEDNGALDYYLSNGLYSAVLSSKGASLCEFALKKRRINIIDNRAPFDRGMKTSPLLKSFSNSINLNGKNYSFENRAFEIEPGDKKRSEFLTTFKSSDLPFLMNKHIRLKNTTFIVDLTLINISQKRLEGSVSYYIYLNSPDFQILNSDVKNSIEKGILVNGKTVRYTDKSSEIEAVFSSTEFFRLREEDVYQEQFTSSGAQRFPLYKKVTFEIPTSIEPNKAALVRLVLRVNDLKEKRDVH